jgi:Fe-S cluster assembly protein SufD
MPAFPVRLGAAEETLIAQLKAAGADQAAERITVAGLPTRRVESYHYTDLKTLVRAIPPLAQAANEATATALRVPGAYALSIVNGAVQTAATAPEGVKVGKTQGGVLTNRDDVIVSVSNALTKDVLSLDLVGAIEQVVQIDHRIEGAAGHVADATKIFVAPGRYRDVDHSKVVWASIDLFSSNSQHC